jgi:WD40 repeat protein/TPR repeat protein
MSTHSYDRYPGARSFQDDDVDRKLFRGREKEKDALLHLVLAEDLVVVYAKSGMGKTSLLNAGLMEPLRVEGYLPMSVRLNDPAAGPFRTLFDGIAEVASRQGVEHVPGDETSLWHFFKTLELWRGDDLLTPVLILDQFEELFTLQLPASRGAFIDQLADLVRGKAPRGLPEEPVAVDARPLSLSSPPVKVVISIREDFLGNLEELGRKIPHILNTRFRLDPLSRAEARRAICEPARVLDEQLRTPRFDYAPAAVESILDFLGKRRQQETFDNAAEAEPFQLQLICQHAESIARARQPQGETAAAAAPITYEDLGGDAGIYRMLKGFFDSQIAALADTYGKGKLYRLCEEGLISPQGRRLSLEEREIERRFHVPREALQLLVSRRLFRAEPRVGSFYYELSHDTLVEPVLSSRRRRERSRRLAVASGALAVILLAAGVFGWRGHVRALEHALGDDAERIGSLVANDPLAASDSREALILAVDAVGRDLALHDRLTPSVSLALAQVAEKARITRSSALQDLHATASALAPDGESVVFGKADGRIIISDLVAAQLRTLAQVAGPVTRLAFSAGSRRVAAVIAGKRLRLWTAEGQPAGGPYDIAGGVRAMAFAPDGRCLAVATPTGLQLLDVAARRRSAERPQAGITQLTFSPDGKRLLSLQHDGTGRLWDVPSPGDLAASAIPLVLTSKVLGGSFGGNLQAVLKNDGSLWIGGPQARRPQALAGVEVTAPFALSPEGRQIAVALGYGGFDLYDLRAGEERAGRGAGEAASGDAPGVAGPGGKRHFESRSFSATTALALAPKEGYAVGGEEDGTITYYDLANGKTADFPAHTGPVRAVAIDVKGGRLISGGVDCAVKVWSFDDRSKGTLKRPFRRAGRGCSILSLAVDPESQFFAVGDEEGRVEMWSFAGRRLSPIFMGPPAVALEIGPHGKLISAHLDSTVREWSTDQGRNLSPRPRGQIDLPRLRMTAATFAPDGALVLGSQDGRWRRFAPPSFAQPASQGKIELDAERGESSAAPRDAHAVALQVLAFSRDGQNLISGDAAGGLRLWSLDGRPLAGLIPGKGSPVASAGFSDHDLLAVAEDHVLTAWDRYGMSPPEAPEVHLGEGYGLAVDPQGAFFATLSSIDGTKELAVWDLRTARKLAWGRKFDECEPASVAIRPDGLALVVGCEDGQIALVSSWLGELPHEVSKKPEQTAVRAVAFDPRGQYFVTGDDQGQMSLWSPRGKPLAVPWSAHRGPVRALAVSPDGQWIASAGSESSPVGVGAGVAKKGESNVKLWKRSKMGEVKVLPGHRHGGVNSLAFSPDGKTLLTGGDDEMVRFWNVEDRGERQPLETGVRVSSVSFSPDGSQILTAGFDGSLRLWDLQNHPLTPAFPGAARTDSTEMAVQAAFSPHGDVLVRSAAQGTTLLRRGDWHGWLRVACDRLRREIDWGRRNSRERDAAETCERWEQTEEGEAESEMASRAPLLAAVREGREETARALLAEKADPTAGDAFGDTPLHAAAARGDLPMIDLLLRAGAAPGAGNRYGVTPLMNAAYRGHAAAVRALLDHKAPVDATDDLGNTALMDASRGGNRDVVELLLAQGANVDLENRTLARMTALFWAKRERHPDIVELLQKRQPPPRLTDALPTAKRIHVARYAPSHLRAFAEALESQQTPTQDAAMVRIFHALYRLAEKGDSFAQLLVGYAYAQGLGVGESPDAAFVWYHRSAAQDDPLGQAALGMAYWMAEGQHLRQNVKQALFWNQRSASQGHPVGQWNLGRMYGQGIESIGMAKRPDTALCYYLMAAREHLPGVTCEAPPPSSRRWTGDPAALNSVGASLDDGDGYEEDTAASHDYILRAANLGDIVAQRNVGRHFLYGRGVQRSLPQGGIWLLRGVDKRQGNGMDILGDLNLHGMEEPTSVREALAWYRRGAEAGEMWAQLDLGWMLERGVGGRRSPMEAISWYRKAAAQGNFSATQKLESLGMMP